MENVRSTCAPDGPCAHQMDTLMSECPLFFGPATPLQYALRSVPFLTLCIIIHTTSRMQHCFGIISRNYRGFIRLDKAAIVGNSHLNIARRGLCCRVSSARARPRSSRSNNNTFTLLAVDIITCGYETMLDIIQAFAEVR